MLIYSGWRKEDRAKEGVGLLVHQRLQTYIQDIMYVNERIMKVLIKIKNREL